MRNPGSDKLPFLLEPCVFERKKSEAKADSESKAKQQEDRVQANKTVLAQLRVVTAHSDQLEEETRNVLGTGLDSLRTIARGLTSVKDYFAKQVNADIAAFVNMPDQARSLQELVLSIEDTDERGTVMATMLASALRTVATSPGWLNTSANQIGELTEIQDVDTSGNGPERDATYQPNAVCLVSRKSRTPGGDDGDTVCPPGIAAALMVTTLGYKLPPVAVAAAFARCPFFRCNLAYWDGSDLHLPLGAGVGCVARPRVLGPLLKHKSVNSIGEALYVAVQLAFAFDGLHRARAIPVFDPRKDGWLFVQDAPQPDPHAFLDGCRVMLDLNGKCIDPAMVQADYQSTTKATAAWFRPLGDGAWLDPQTPGELRTTTVSLSAQTSWVLGRALEYLDEVWDLQNKVPCGDDSTTSVDALLYAMWRDLIKQLQCADRARRLSTQVARFKLATMLFCPELSVAAGLCDQLMVQRFFASFVSALREACLQLILLPPWAWRTMDWLRIAFASSSDVHLESLTEGSLPISPFDVLQSGADAESTTDAGAPSRSMAGAGAGVGSGSRSSVGTPSVADSESVASMDVLKGKSSTKKKKKRKRGKK